VSVYLASSAHLQYPSRLPVSSDIFLNNDRSTATHSRGKLTCSSLLYLFCRDGQNRQYLHYDFGDHVHHRCSRWDLRIGLQSSEKVFDTLEKVSKYTSTRFDILSRLRELDIRMRGKVKSKNMRTKSSTPIPAKTTLAGENTW
jgi:hypothetical protein